MPEKHLEAVKALDLYPNIQYSFLKDVVSNGKFDKLDDGVKLIYLETMCKIDPYKVSSEVEIKLFPLK